MVEFLGSFQKRGVQKLLYSWAFLYFNPRHIGRDLFCRYFSSVADYISGAIQTGDRHQLELLLRTLDYLVTFGYCIILAMASKANGAKILAVEKRAPVVVQFCSAVSAALGALSGFKHCSLLNSEFVYFLDLVSTYIEPAAFYHIFGLYLSALNSAKPVDLGNAEAPRVTGVGAPIKLALTTIRHFAVNPGFLITASQIESQVPGLLTAIYQDALLVNDTKLVQRCTIVYSELARCVEAPGADVARLSELLFPLLSCSAVLRNHEVLKNDSVASEHFAILILLLVHSVGADHWKQVFTLFNDDQ
jgi:hypothetical protein